MKEMFKVLTVAKWPFLVFIVYTASLGAFFFGATRSSIAAFILTRVPQYSIDFLQLFLILFFALNIGSQVLRWLKLEFKSSSALVVNSIALGYGVLSLIFLALGLMSLFYTWVAWLILLVGTCWSVVMCLRTGLAKVLLNRFLTVCKAPNVGYIEGMVLAGGISALAYSIVVNTLIPPLEWDSLAYHLAIPKQYIAAHSIIYIPDIVQSNWPFNMEILYTFALLLGSERLPQLISLSFALLTGLAIFSFARSYFDRRVGILAASFFFLLPVVRRVSGTAMVDIPLGLFAFLGVIAYWLWLEESKKQWLVLSALFVGFAAGAKLPGVSTALLLGFGLLVLTSIQFVRTGRLNLVNILVFGCFSFVLVLPWYVKSYVMTGNPIWPFLDGVFPSKNWDAFGTVIHNTWLRDYWGTGISLSSLLMLPWNLFMSESFGPALGLPGITLLPLSLLCFRRTKYVWYLALFLVGTILIWFFLTQQNRFLTPAFPVICVLAGAGFWRLHDSGLQWGKLALTAMLTVWLFLTSPFLSSNEMQLWNQRLPYVVGEKSRDVLLSENINAYDVFSFANANLPDTSRILLLPYEDRAFYLDRKYFWGNPVSQRVIKFEQIETSDALWKIVQELGFSHVIINPFLDLPQMPFANHYSALIDSFKRDYLVPLYTAQGVTLYRISDQKQPE